MTARLREALRGPGGRHRAATALLVAALLGWVAVSFRSFGISYDEPLQQTYGAGVVRWFETDGADRTALTFNNLFLYGGLFEAAAELWARALAPLDLYDARHLLNALVGVLGVLGAYALGSAWGGPRAGWWAALLLAALPTWNGHIFFNSKDVPFAVGYLWTFAFLLRAHREYPRVRWSTAALLGVAMGCTMGVRVGGLILWGMLALSLGTWAARAWLAHPSRRGALLRALPRVGAATFLSLGVSYGLMLVAWPWARLAPFSRPFAALGEFSHFAGKLADRGALARHLAIYTAKVPEVVWALAAAGAALALAAAVRRPRRRLTARAGQTALLAAAAAVPVAYLFVNRSPIYNEVRHLIFVQAVLAVTAGCALARLRARARGRRGPAVALGAAVAVGIGAPVVEAARLFPYQYAYYNAVSGGLPAAAARGRALDYWAVTYREAAGWLAGRARSEGATPERPAPVVVVKPVPVAEYYFPPWLRAVREGGAYRIAARDRGSRRERPERNEVIHRIERRGVVLCTVERLAPEGDGTRRGGRRGAAPPGP